MIREIQALEERLNDFDPACRRDSLAALLQLRPAQPAPSFGNVNLHCHSFFSYNAYGYSPTRIAWEAAKQGLYAIGLCDFDVLDGLSEFLDATRQLRIRSAVYLETRSFLHEFSDVDINSPGENGVSYIMGGGFVALPLPGSPQVETLKSLRDSAQARNEALIQRINKKLDPVRIGYVREVLPLTPRGVATERHIVSAYIAKSRKRFSQADEFENFWSSTLGATPAQIHTWIDDRPTFEEKVRSALVKRGGLGYQPPTAASFPSVDLFVQWVRECGAIPLITWLDGTSDGEKQCEKMVDCLQAKGCAGLNIIPDRNWNFQDPEEKKKKVRRLNEVIREAVRRNLPVNIGTEMNKSGQPFADDLSGPVLSRHRDVFLQGAQIFVGHTLLSRYAGVAYLGAQAESEWPDVRKRNAFFAAVGSRPSLSLEQTDRLENLGPEKAFHYFQDLARDSN